MGQGPEALFPVGDAASEASFEAEGCLSMLGLAIPERGMDSKSYYWRLFPPLLCRPGVSQF